MSRPAATAAEKAHMGFLKKLPCVCCRSYLNIEVHHIVNGYRCGHLYTIPLCHNCHERIKNKVDENNLIRQLVWRKDLYTQFNLDCPPYVSKIPYINKLMAEAGL